MMLAESRLVYGVDFLPRGLLLPEFNLSCMWPKSRKVIVSVNDVIITINETRYDVSPRNATPLSDFDQLLEQPASYPGLRLSIQTALNNPWVLSGGNNTVIISFSITIKMQGEGKNEFQATNTIMLNEATIVAEPYSFDRTQQVFIGWQSGFIEKNDLTADKKRVFELGSTKWTDGLHRTRPYD